MPPEVPKNAERSIERLEKVKSEARALWTEYDEKAIWQQIQIAKEKMKSQKITDPQADLFQWVENARSAILGGALDQESPEKEEDIQTRTRYFERSNNDLKMGRSHLFSVLKNLESKEAKPENERKGLAESHAKKSLLSYDMDAIEGQLQIIEKVSKDNHNERLFADVRKSQLRLKVKLDDKNNVSATELEAHARHLDNVVSRFTGAVSILENLDNAEPARERAFGKITTEQRIARARTNAETVLAKYKKMSDQIEKARGKVNREIISKVIQSQGILLMKLYDKKYSTATELEALIQTLEDAMEKFSRAVDKKQAEASDQNRAKEIEKVYFS